MEVVFITHEDDEMGMYALEMLDYLGYPTLVIDCESDVEPHHVALFTRIGTEHIDGGKGTWLKCVSIAFNEDNAPEWVLETIHRVQVKRVPTVLTRNFRKALFTMAKGYVDFDPNLRSQSAPWFSGELTYQEKSVSGRKSAELFRAFLTAVRTQSKG
jgi:hypothetical protein